MSDACVLEGTIVLERGCVLHPKAVIIVAPTCTVTFGAGCVVEENAVLHFPGPGNATVGQGNAFQVGCAVDLVPDAVGPASAAAGAGAATALPGPDGAAGHPRAADTHTHTPTPAADASATPTPIVPSIGEWNTFAPRSRVKSVRVGDWCTFGPGTALRPDHPQLELEDAPGARRWKAVPSQSVVYGATSRIRRWDGSGKEHELGVRRSATEFLREILPKCVDPGLSAS